jgi:hypothetical protein
VTHRLSETDRIHLRDAVVLLTSSAMMRACKDYLDLSGEQAADRITWAVLTLCGAAGTIAKAETNENEA